MSLEDFLTHVERGRADMQPAPVAIGSKVWLGAGVTVVPGVPARFIRSIDEMVGQ